MQDNQQKSRLGSLLINKGLISDKQLSAALREQQATGLRLGEVLIKQGMLSERQLQKALKKQSRHRLWAAVLAMALGPMSFGAFASQSQTSHTETNVASQMKDYNGLKALDDNELASIEGQGFQSHEQALASLLDQANGGESDQLGPLDELATLLNPIVSLLDAEVSVTGVKYHHGQQNKVNEDGSIELALPSEIKEIAFRNLRVKGDQSGRSFGDVVISNIQFSEQSSIRVRVH